ncbi:MAG: hypothetical protein U1F43_01535 [Myxococcota bacterium]
MSLRHLVAIPVRIAALCAVCAALAACGHDPAPKGEAKASGPPAPWETMGFEARKAYMEKAVLPRMREVFEAYDPVFFADVGCTTCHGLDAEERRFAMPNPDILALYPTGHPKQIELVQKQPQMLRFMFGTVVPEVQALLGLPSYDPATKQGFSCFACHPRGAEPGATP